MAGQTARGASVPVMSRPRFGDVRNALCGAVLERVVANIQILCWHVPQGRIFGTWRRSQFVAIAKIQSDVL